MHSRKKRHQFEYAYNVVDGEIRNRSWLCACGLNSLQGSKKIFSGEKEARQDHDRHVEDMLAAQGKEKTYARLMASIRVDYEKEEAERKAELVRLHSHDETIIAK